MTDFKSGAESILLCDTYGCPASEIVRHRGCSRTDTTHEALDERMKQVLTIMKNATSRPIQRPHPSMNGLIGGGAGLMKRHLREEKSICGRLFSKAISYVMVVLEINSSVGLIVAAPTAGSSEVVPGVLLALSEEHDPPDGAILPVLHNASATGYLVIRNIAVPEAMGGCQAGVGVVSAMATNTAVELVGGTSTQCLENTSIALTNLLGLVCDPVGGLVEHLYRNRNAIGAASALTSTELALSGIRQLIPLSEILTAMYNVERRPSPDFREAAMGRCAVTPSRYTACGG